MEITAIKIRERGPVPRNLRKLYKQYREKAWYAAGKYWHNTFRELRFTKKHAKERI